MRIAVLGVGAMGGTIAALLDRAGHELEVTARGEHLDAIRERGLRLSGGFGEHLARPQAGPTLTARPEFAVLATKAQHAAAALAPNAALLDGVPLLVVQNGLDGPSVAAAAAPGARILGACSLIAASFLTPGEITVTAALPTFLGRTPSADTDALARVEETLGAVMPIRVVNDLVGAQWTKLLVNHMNALPAVTGLSMQATIADPRLRRILVASQRETIGIARRIGARFVPLGGLNRFTISALGSAPAPLAGFVALAASRRMGSVPNPGSTLQSIRRGVPTEIDALNGAVVRIAEAEGLDAPINRELTRLVHEVERTGQFFDGAQLVAAVETAIRRAKLR